MRFTFVILLFLSLGADAQMIIKAHANYRPYVAAAPGANLLLDDYPNAAAAYSLRKLDKDYTGSAIRVRRSNDNAEQDIGFTSSGDLDTASLKTFVGANSGFVTTWYDQSGNTRNATQTTAANQPRIVNAGTVERQNSKVSTFYDGAGDGFGVPDFALPTSSIFSAAINTGATASNIHTIYSRGTTGANASRDAMLYLWRTNNTVEYQRSNGTLFPTATRSATVTNFNLYSGFYTGTQLNVYANGVIGTSANTTISGSTNPTSTIGATGEVAGFTYLFLGRISEIIVYASDQSSNRTGIENNINDYYNIYWNGDFAGLLDSFPSSAAAYSLRNLDKDYTGPLVRVRRSNDNAEQDIFGDYYGNLDTVGLKNFVGAGNNGFVTVWYDQSGNARNATQTTAADQPRIVNAGIIDRRGLRPTIKLIDNTDKFFHQTQYVSANDIYYVTHTTDNTWMFQSTDNSSYGFTAQNGSSSTTIYQSYGSPTLFINNVQFTGTTRGNLYTSYNNTFALSAIINANISTWGTFPVRIGGYSGGAGFEYNGDVSEYIIYPNTSTNRTGIQNNINTYFSIY